MVWGVTESQAKSLLDQVGLLPLSGQKDTEVPVVPVGVPFKQGPAVDYSYLRTEKFTLVFSQR